MTVVKYYSNSKYYRIMKKLLVGILSTVAMLLPLAAGAVGIGDATGNLTKYVGPTKTGLSDDLPGTVASVVSAALVLVGTIFLLLTIYAGILWMTARGEEEQIEKAIKILKATVIGLFITMAAYAITFFVTSRLATAPKPTGPGRPGGTGDTECAAKGGKCDYVANIKADCSGSPESYSGSAGECAPEGNNQRVCCLAKTTREQCGLMGGKCSSERCGGQDTPGTEDDTIDLGIWCSEGEPPGPYCCKPAHP